MTDNQQAARELLPCPWCGPHGDPFNEQADWCSGWRVGCTICGCTGPIERTHDDAEKAWNRRPTQPDSGEK